MNFPFETNGKLMILGVPILKHFRVSYFFFFLFEDIFSHFCKNPKHQNADFTNGPDGVLIKGQEKNMCISGYMEFQNRDGTVGRIFFFYFVQNFYMGIIGKQYVRMGKSQGIL